MAKYLTDDEVFGKPATQYLSDAEVFGEEPADTGEQPDQEVVTSARAWRGAGAGRGSAADPRRLDTQKQESVLQGVRMDEPQFDPAEAERLSRREYAQRPVQDPNAPSMTAPTDKLIPINERGIIGRAADLTGAQIDQYAAGLGAKVGDAAAAVGLDGAATNLRNRSANLIDRADRTGKSVALSADGSFEKYAPQILSVFPTMAVAAATGGLPVMFGISEMQSYAESRAAGKSPMEALARAVPMGAAEVLGEKLGGTGRLLTALEKATARGMTSESLKELSGSLAAAGLKEVPSEEATYAMQFGIDKAPGIGLNQDATAADFVEGAKDTAIVAAGAGAGMAGVGAGAAKLAGARPAPMNAEALARSKGFLVADQQPARVTNFTDPSGPVGQAGITPVVVPIKANPGAAAPSVEPVNVGNPGATDALAGGVGAVPGDQSGAGVVGAGQVPAVGGGVGAAPAQPSGVAGSPAAGGDAGQPAAGVNPVPRTSDADLLARVPVSREPEEVMMRRGGGGYESQESAQTALETAKARNSTLEWRIEPMDNGNFRVAGYAQEASKQGQEPSKEPTGTTALAKSPEYAVPATDFRMVPQSKREQKAMETKFPNRQSALDAADAAGIADNVEVEDTGKAYRLLPAKPLEDVSADPETAQTLEDFNQLTGEQTSLASASALPGGADSAGGAGRQLALRAVGRVARVTQAAFGFQPVAITGLNGYGVAYKGRAFVDVDSVAEDGGSEAGVARLAIFTIGHEALHSQLEKSQDQDDRAFYDKFAQVVHNYVKDGVYQRREAQEDQSAGRKMGMKYAMREVMADVSGAMWMDPRFWKRLHEIDNGSTMRRIAYKFMQAATKFIRVAKGSRMDIDTLVSNVEAVREAAAQVWAEKAKRNSKSLESRTAIKEKLFDTEPAYSRKAVVGEVAPNPSKEVAQDWNAMSDGERTMANRDVGRRVFQGVMDINGLRGWSINFSTGQYQGAVNPNFIIEAPQDATFDQLTRVASDIGFVLDQQSMVAFDESDTSGQDMESFVKVELPEGFPQAKLNDLRKQIANNLPQADADTLVSPTELAFGNFSRFSDKPVDDASFRAAIRRAVQDFDWDGGPIRVSEVERYRSQLIWPDNRNDYVRSGNGQGDRLQAGSSERGDDVRRSEGRRLIQLRKLAREALGRRDNWIGNSAAGKQRAEERRRSAAADSARADAPRAEYGTATPGAVSAVGVHFSQERRSNISSRFSGSGLKGLERERLSDPANADIRPRIYFYVDAGNGVTPEAGVGGVKHVVKLNNLYDVKADALGIVKTIKGADAAERATNIERMVMRAGFDGFLADTGATQKFAVLIGKHDIAYSRRPLTEDDINDKLTRAAMGPTTDSIYDDLPPDLLNAVPDDYREALLATRQPAPAAPAPATPTLDKKKLLGDRIGPSLSPKQVTLADMKKHGLLVEELMPVKDITERNGYMSLEFNQDYGPYGSFGNVSKQPNGKFNASVSGSWLHQVDDLADAVKFAKAQAVSAYVAATGFDLASVYRKGTVQRLVQTWRALAAKAGMFKTRNYRGNTTSFTAIADELGAFDKTKWRIAEVGSRHIMVDFKSIDGSQEFSASMTLGSRYMNCCTMGLNGSSGSLGTGFYAVAAELARRRGLQFAADSQLSGINSYRRTEQAASFALKTGDTGVLLPGPQNRVYGFNERPATPEDHNLNIARLMLAGLRNVMEVYPDVRRLKYNPNTDQFTTFSGQDATDKVAEVLQRPIIRTMGIGRTTLARASITSQIISGTMSESEVAAFKAPIAYSRKLIDIDSEFAFPTSAKAINFIGMKMGLTEAQVVEEWGFIDPQDYITLAEQLANKDIAKAEKQALADALFAVPERLSESWGEPGELTPQVERFLGGSVMRREDGTPIVMYHGTARDIEQFTPKQAGAIFLTENPDFAESFAYSSEMWMAENYRQVLTIDQIEAATERAVKIAMAATYYSMSERKKLAAAIRSGTATGEAQDMLMEEVKKELPSAMNILPLIVRAEQPFDYTNQRHVEEVMFTLKDRLGDSPEIELVKEGGQRTSNADRIERSIKSGAWEYIESPQVQDVLKELGFDSFWVKENGQKNLAVYSPTQIKSALGNNGNYDPEDPRIAYSRKGLESYIEDRNKSMQQVSPQSVLDADIDLAVKAIEAASKDIASGTKDFLPVPLGGTPHPLRMIGLPSQMLYVDANILKKVLFEKHSKDFADVDTRSLVSAIYRPAMVLRGRNGDAEIVTSLTTNSGPIIIPLAANTQLPGGKRATAIKSAYARNVAGGGDSIVSRVRAGNVAYVDMLTVQQAMTGQVSTAPEGINAAGAQFLPTPPSVRRTSTVANAEQAVKPRNPNYVGWSAVRDIIMDGIAAKKIKTDVDLMRWIGDNYRADRNPGGWDDAPAFSRRGGLPGESRFMAVRRKLQDQFIQVKVVQDVLTQRGGTVGEAQDVYRAEERMHGRTTALLQDFARNQIEPFLDAVAKAKLDINEVALYAYAMHAKERNAYIKSINPKIGDAGSGMSDIEADNILQLAQLSGDKPLLDQLHQRLMGITDTTRMVLLQEGLITQEEFDGWTGLYEHYVPLRGFEHVDPEGNPRPGVGRGFSMTGKESIKALGRKSKAGQILENIIRDHERAVVRAEKNAVAKTFLDLALSNPDPDLWEVDPVKVSRSFNKATATVLMRNTPDTGEDTFAIKVAGQQVRVKVHDELLLRALKLAAKDETSQLERLLASTLGAYTDLMRNTLTRYNPIFGAINAVRDAQMGAVSAFDELGAEGLKRYVKHFAAAMAASWRSERGRPGTGPMDRWMEEMRFAGGSTGGYHTRDLSEITKDMQTLLLQAGAAPKTKMETLRASLPYRQAQVALHWLEVIGATSEDAARVAAYRSAREMGKTPAQAASISKNLTTNFNRKGEWGQTINSLYLFFNAGVQGTTRVIEALGSRRVQYLMAGLTAASMAIALANAGAGDDDDGQAYWDKIPDYEKERNLIFMLPEGTEMDGATKIGKRGRYIKVPMPYGLNIFPVLGMQLADLVRYARDPSRGAKPVKAAVRMASAVFGSVNPFGGSVDPMDGTQVAMAVAPSVADLGIQLWQGVNAFGRPVGPQRVPFDEKPDSENFTARQAGSASQHVARWLNSVSGGNEGRSGLLDFQPGTLDNLVRNTTGGLGVFLADTLVNLPTKLYAAPETVSQRDVALWRNFYGEVDSATDLSIFYERRQEVVREMEAAKREMKLGLDIDYSPESLTLQSLGKASESYTRWMTQLRKREIEIAADPNMTRGEKLIARKELDKQRGQLATDFNTLYNESMKKR